MKRTDLNIKNNANWDFIWNYFPVGMFVYIFFFQILEDGIKIYKGTNPDIDSYSVFWDNMKLSDTTLDAHLKAHKITDVYICGLAYDVCVGEYQYQLNDNEIDPITFKILYRL